MDRWRGKVAVVTGAASGIGEAITRALLDSGVNVAGFDLQVDRLRKKADEQKRRDSAAVLHPVYCDVSRGEDLKRGFAWVEEHLGGLHILVNNAGITNYTEIIESDRAAFERLININVLAMATCISEAVRSMRARNVEGHIFNVNSIIGHVIPEGVSSEVDGANGWNLYPTSKHATVAMTHTVRRELSRARVPIRITSLSPGLVKTQITQHTEGLKDFFEKVPALLPEDIADGLIYALGTRPEVQITELAIQRTGELV